MSFWVVADDLDLNWFGNLVEALQFAKYLRVKDMKNVRMGAMCE